MTFKTEGYQIIRQVISKDLVENLKIQFRMLKDTSCHISGKMPHEYTDGQVEKSFSWYSYIGFESLLIQLHSLLEKITEKKLYPCYSYARIYYKDSILRKHIDRPSCEFSATLCIDSDSKWELFFMDKNNQIKAINLDPGDICIYRGRDLVHWRNKYPGKEHIQAFFHYVDSSGPYSDFKFDKRKMLGLSKEYKEGHKNKKIYNYG